MAFSCVHLSGIVYNQNQYSSFFAGEVVVPEGGGHFLIIGNENFASEHSTTFLWMPLMIEVSFLLDLL